MITSLGFAPMLHLAASAPAPRNDDLSDLSQAFLILALSLLFLFWHFLMPRCFAPLLWSLVATIRVNGVNVFAWVEWMYVKHSPMIAKWICEWTRRAFLLQKKPWMKRNQGTICPWTKRSEWWPPSSRGRTVPTKRSRKMCPSSCSH